MKIGSQGFLFPGGEMMVDKEPVGEQPDSGQPEANDSNDEESQAKKIGELLDEGYTPVQIEKDWGFPHATVRDVAKKRIIPKAVVSDVDEELNKMAGFPKLPMILKAGRDQESISPEAMLQGCLLSDGDAGAWMYKGMMLLRAAQLMNLTDVEIMKGQAEAQAKAMAPILNVMEQARRDMDAAALRARESSADVAASAAAGAAARAVAHIDERFDEMKQQKADIATVPDPMKGLMARTMEMMLNKMTGTMSGGTPGPTPGLVDKRGQGGK